jgi:hypothetical protein
MLTAAYGGDANFAAATATLTETVSRVATTTTLTASPNPARAGDPVTFTAVVSGQAPGAGTPTGTVSFSVDGMPPTAVTVVNGVATLTLTRLPAGPHTVTASYGGDTTFAGSTASVTETVRGLEDVSGLVKVTPVVVKGKHGKKAKANPLMQTLLVTNTSGAAIQGPVYLVLDGLTGGVTLTNATGVSQTHVKAGDPFVLLTADPLGAGQSVTVNLVFATTHKKAPPVNFTTFVLAGPGAV